MSDVKNDSIKKLQDNRQAIHFIELAGLLHDIGKLGAAFLEYRKTWQDSDDHDIYDKDPHDHDFFDNDKLSIPPDFAKNIIIDILGVKDYSIKRAVHEHIKPGDDITWMLKAADGIDAAIDRNNPLWSAEQKEEIFKSNVFGFESTIIKPEDQESIREKLYGELRKKLPEYLKTFKTKERDELLEIIKKAFNQGLSDTTRPQNDTTLWEHSYAVSSILKCLTVHNLFSDKEKQIYKFDDVRFAILGVGWDGMRFISYGQKIGDIVSRKNIIEEIKREIKDLIEDKYPIGNEIYADDNGIYFVVPTELNCGALNKIWECLKDKIYIKAADISLGELQPHIEIFDGKVADGQKGTRTLTGIVDVVKNLKAKRNYPFDSSVKGFNHFKDKLSADIKDKKSVCPICRFRPVQSEDKKKKICEVCLARRRKSGAQADKDNATIFIDEIIDKNNNAAVIVARFGLNEWINGNMIRSLFVTDANGIENEIGYLGKVKQFGKEELEIKQWLETNIKESFDFNRIVKDIDAIRNNEERGKYTRFLYDMRVIPVTGGYMLLDNLDDTEKRFKKLEDDAKAECNTISIYNLLNAKTPTPSTILDVWKSTTDFFTDFKNNIINSNLPEKSRLCLVVEEKIEKSWNGAIEAEIRTKGRKEKVEILYREESKVEIVGKCFPTEKSADTWRNSKVKIFEGGNLSLELTVKKCEAGRAFQAYRTITTSPNLFLAIVPADCALEITRQMYKEYTERFGKVMGRLPFSIGNVFFKNTMPMFVVLDSAKRLIANFDNLALRDKVKTFKAKTDSVEILNDSNVTIEGKLGELYRTVTWKLPSNLGNGIEDYYHPYFVVANAAADRKTYFETVAGKVVHFNEIKKDDMLELYLNYYDFEYLDSNARRYDITADNSNRRKSNLADFRSKPYLLDELDQKIMPLWSDIQKDFARKGLSDTKLRNLLSLWLTNYQEWQVALEDKSNPSYEQWIKLIESSANKELPGIYPLISETLANGIFFDTLEIYLGIMKERIAPKRRN
jgi:CRISPR-associated Csx11 family protein